MSFSSKVLIQLSRRVGGACSMCHAGTTGPHTDPTKSVNVGEGAHIRGEKPGAARYDSKLSKKEIASIENGIWLCGPCHKKADDDEGRYSVDGLRKMRKDAEDNADLAMSPMAPSSPIEARGSLLAEVRGITDAHRATISAMQDADVRYVTDRIAAFPQQVRLPHLSGYLFGLSAEMYGRLNDQEFASIFTQVTAVTVGITTTLIRAANRMTFEMAKEFRETVRPTNAELTHQFAQGLNWAMIHRLYFAGHPDFAAEMQPNLIEYGKLSFHDQLKNNAPQAWDLLQQCLSRYDPRRHAPGSDEEFRRRIALKALDGITVRDEFERKLLAAIDQYMPEMQKRHDEFMALLPTDFLVICDARGVWRTPDLLRRMHAAMEQVQVIRDAVRQTAPSEASPASGPTSGGSSAGP